MGRCLLIPEDLGLGPELDAKVTRAAHMALAIAADIDRADEVVSDNGLTPSQFRDLMNELSRDDALRLAFNRLVRELP